MTGPELEDGDAAVVSALSQPEGCTCANDDWAGYALYAMGRAEYASYMRELQAACRIHG